MRVATVYAYVARRGIRLVKSPGSKSHKYWRADVVAAATGKTVSPEKKIGEEAAAVTLITDDGPFYRGSSAVSPAQTLSLEEVASVLWQCDVSVFDTDAFTSKSLPAGLLAATADLTIPDRAVVAFLTLGRLQPALLRPEPGRHVPQGGRCASVVSGTAHRRDRHLPLVPA